MSDWVIFKSLIEDLNICAIIASAMLEFYSFYKLIRVKSGAEINNIPVTIYCYCSTFFSALICRHSKWSEAREFNGYNLWLLGNRYYYCDLFSGDYQRS